MKENKTLKPITYTWLIAYINSDYLEKVYTDLNKMPEYKDIEVYIPTVKVLKKTFKGENHFEEIPLLFNYGFFKVPIRFAIYPSYLDNMKNNIRCIFQWVKDPVKVMRMSPKLRRDRKAVYKDTDIPVATATSQEISELVKSAYYSTLHSSDDVENLQSGQVIQLRGYPFDQMWAKIIEVFPKKHKVKVEIQLLDAIRPVMVSFDNIFFTVYHNKGWDDSLSAQHSLDEFLDNRIIQ